MSIIKEAEENERMRDLRRRRQEVMHKRKKWKEEYEQVTTDILEEGGLERAPPLDSDHHPLLNSGEEDAPGGEEIKKEDAELGGLDTMCLVCVYTPCICDLVKLEERILTLKSGRRGQEEPGDVDD